MAYTQQVAMCLSDKVTFQYRASTDGLHSTGVYLVYVFQYRASTDSLTLNR